MSVTTGAHGSAPERYEQRWSSRLWALPGHRSAVYVLSRSTGDAGSARAARKNGTCTDDECVPRTGIRRLPFEWCTTESRLVRRRSRNVRAGQHAFVGLRLPGDGLGAVAWAVPLRAVLPRWTLERLRPSGCPP
jgi:hypothetical protein